MRPGREKLMAYKQWDEAETNTYLVKSDNWGNHTLVRKSDNKSLFFQGDDARALDEFLGQSMNEMFDYWLSQYECIEDWDISDDND